MTEESIESIYDDRATIICSKKKYNEIYLPLEKAGALKAKIKIRPHKRKTEIQPSIQHILAQESTLFNLIPKKPFRRKTRVV